MVPPHELNKIKRKVDERPDARKLFLLYEGTNTEPSFLRGILTLSNYIDNDNVAFFDVSRTGDDFGHNSFSDLVNYGLQIISNQTSLTENSKFKKRYDKVVIFFDLDRYHKEIGSIKNKINQYKDNMIFVYTNPAIELFLLLCTGPYAYEKFVENSINDILENKIIDGRRYINHLFQKATGLDPKNARTDFSSLYPNLQDAINQEKIHIKQKLTDADKYLISNFGYFLCQIKNNNFDNITYDLFN